MVPARSAPVIHIHFAIGQKAKKKTPDSAKIFQKTKRENVYFFFERLLTDTKSCDKVKASEERGYKR